MLLIPIRPGAQDFRTMDEFINRYNEAKAFKSEIPAYFLLNEFSPQKKVHEGISQMIESSFDIEVLQTKINSRVAYTEASISGKAFMNIRMGKAKDEMTRLTAEVLEKAKSLQLMERIVMSKKELDLAKLGTASKLKVKKTESNLDAEKAVQSIHTQNQGKEKNKKVNCRTSLSLYVDIRKNPDRRR